MTAFFYVVIVGLVAGLALAGVDSFALHLRQERGLSYATRVWLALVALIIGVVALALPMALLVALPTGIVVSGVLFYWRLSRQRGYSSDFE